MEHEQIVVMTTKLLSVWEGKITDGEVLTDRTYLPPLLPKMVDS
jgi:hypothetical protein